MCLFKFPFILDLIQKHRASSVALVGATNIWG